MPASLKICTGYFFANSFHFFSTLSLTLPFSVFGNNLNIGLPLIHSVVMVLDAENGRILSFMDGEALTNIRTGAGTGVATDILAPIDARILAIIGSGKQARSQLEAVCSVRNIEQIRIYSRTLLNQ